MENNNLQEFWKNHIDNWKSGQCNQAEYCRQNNLLLNRFNYWKRKFSSNSESDDKIKIIKLPPHIPDKTCYGKNDNILTIHFDKNGKLAINLCVDFDLSKVLFK